MAHTDPWDESAPNGATVDANTLDTIIQALKIDIRERLQDLGVAAFATDDPVAFALIRLTGATPYIIGGATRVVEFRLADEVTVVGYIDNTGNLHFDVATVIALAVTNLTVTGISLLSGNVLVDSAQAAITPFDAGVSGGAKTIDWNDSNNQLLTLTGNPVLTLSNPVAGAMYVLKLLQDATGTREPNWPASVKWAGGSFPGCTDTANHSDLITLYCYDGANYLGTVAGFNFSV